MRAAGNGKNEGASAQAFGPKGDKQFNGSGGCRMSSSRRLPPAIVKSSLLPPILLACLGVSGCSSHMYAAEAQRYSQSLTQELERLQPCPERTSCPRVLWEAGGWKIGPLTSGGVHLKVYSVKEPSVAEILGEHCKQLHAQAPQVPVSLVVYSSAHPAESPAQIPVVMLDVHFR